MVQWPSGARAVVEVKAFNPVDCVKAAELVVTDAMFGLMGAGPTIAGLRGRLEWDDATLDAPPSRDAVAVAIQDAIAATRLRPRDSASTVPIQGIGRLQLEPHPGATSLDLTYGGYAPAADAIYRRLRRRSKVAIEQMASHPDLPVILIFDVHDDGLARNGFRRLQHWIGNQSQVAAVLVIEREHSSSGTNGNVCVLEGPRFQEVPDLRFALEVCDAGHVHYQPICTPARPCRSLFAFQSV